ncbi:zinc carboxypeptidase family protein (macronuclear) [Tetrahymena thermophila SB210]|uniref:Zinc carboxypeptidase family protein n=1 Tax=Tetrahymena thermophila (strain SB210) TaxID=312017 RepID=Q22UL4_TETTS|nr:zinc carboxypeptidase family protein [Tetrahymena thermophila SB210]EAR88956.3 zinc carboxypeptidase family protein [Tetrahymena thermophila SB210]|eukprot:XP_001009201.3 zinc carboxypeptidase family protein [Tetrahymena thermophila SB210]
MIQLKQESNKQSLYGKRNMNQNETIIQKKFILSKQFSEDQEEEGFIEEKDLYTYIEIPSSNLKLKENMKLSDGDESDDEEDYKNLKHRFSLHLPEANPLLDNSKQINYEPKLLLDNITIKKQTLDQQTNSSKITNNQIPQNQQQKRAQQMDRSNQAYLYDKYMKDNLNYKLIYSKYSEKREESEMDHNFAGYYINLANVFTLGKHISKELIGETDIFQQLREKHKYKSITSSPRGSSNNLDQNASNHQINYLSDQDQIIVSEDIQDELVNQQEQLVFDSRFESGNLMYAFQRRDPKYSDEYDLIICNDINSKGYAQWFYFSISKTKKDKTIKLNLVNHSKKQSLFKNGMKPAIFSVKKNKNEKEKSWERGGNNVKYYQNQILKEETYDNYYYTLSFSYTFEYDDDVVYFAMSYPYSYTQMINHLNTTIEKCQLTQPLIQIKKEILCHTISNNAVPLLTITNKEKDQIEKGKTQNPPNESKQKKIAMLMARQHPGETVSSFLMQGVIDFLVSDCVEANFLRNKYIFKIIPMVNPDGVLYGNFRCNLSGVDLNRQWSNPNKLLHPTVYSIKNLISKYRQQDYQIDYFIDLHGHSKKLNSFVYACKMESDQYACCLFPMMLSKLNPVLHYPSCTFGLESYKENTARGIAWNSGVNKPNIFTIETSFFGYNDKKNGGRATHFKIQDLTKLGGDLIRCMFAYYIENNADESLKQQLQLTLKAYKQVRKSVIIQDIIKSNIQQNSSSYLLEEDSGSDSDPLIDELNVKEKINNVIGVKIAKSIGLINQSNMNSENVSGSEKSKQQPYQQRQQKRNSSISTNSTGPSQRIKQKNVSKDSKLIQIQNQNYVSNQNIKKSPSQIINYNESLNLKEEDDDEADNIQESDINNKDFQEKKEDQEKLDRSLSSRQQKSLLIESCQSNNQNQIDFIEEIEQDNKFKEKKYHAKVRNQEREQQREQCIKFLKEEVYKKRFRISKNTPLTTPKSYNILIDPKTIMKYKSSNIAAFLQNSYANNYYGYDNTNINSNINNTNEDNQGQDASHDNSIDQIHKEQKKQDQHQSQDVNINFPKNRFHPQNGLKGVNTFKQAIQQLQTEAEQNLSQANWFNPLNPNGWQQDQSAEKPIKSARSGRLQSAINRFSHQKHVDSNSQMVIQGQQNKQVIQESKIYAQNPQELTQQNQQGANTTNNHDSQQVIQRSNSTIKKNQQNEPNTSNKKNGNLIKNFSKILKENSKKYNCDTKILHLSRNTTSCQTQRRISFQEKGTKLQQIHLSQIEQNDYYSNYKEQNSNMKSTNNQNQNQTTTAEKCENQSNQQEKLPKKVFGLLAKDQNQIQQPYSNNIKLIPQSTQNSFNETQTPTQKHIRSGTGSGKNQRNSYFRQFKMNNHNNQNTLNQSQYQEQFKNYSLKNKISAMKFSQLQSKSEIKHIINNSQQIFNQYQDLNNSDVLLNSWNPEVNHIKLKGIFSQKYNEEASKTAYQTPKNSQDKKWLTNLSYLNSKESSSKQIKQNDTQYKMDGIRS